MRILFLTVLFFFLYLIGNAQVIKFKQLDGTMSQGVLYKPENFDSTKKYPLIISFYYNLSDQLFQFPTPEYLTNNAIFDNPVWMVSHGYLVFVPDIYFTQGQWGPSTVNTIDGAAQFLRNLPYVDANSLGACGHSNSGRLGYYLLTHSKSFSAMSIGAGSTDIISDALSMDDKLPWAEKDALGSGLGELWKNKQTWLDHTAVMHANSVESPLLLFHNKADGVPVLQAIEMFNALRRLEKKVWWLQYDKGDHILWEKNEMQDFTIRYMQFFDHYLKGAPAPQWMTEGIIAKDKAIEAKYELNPSGTCTLQGKNHCYICEAWNKQYKHNPSMFEKPITEWELDKDIKEELLRKTIEERRRLDNEGVKQQREVLKMLKEPMKD